MTVDPREVRCALVDALEGRYYSGATAGQLWLRDLSAYLRSVPAEDPLFTRLAEAHGRRGFGRYLELAAHPHLTSLDPASWFEGYFAWASGHAVPDAPPSDPQVVHDGL